MIFVSVGTHEDPFDRLVRAAESLAQSGAQVRLQKGPSLVPTPTCDAQPYFSAPEMYAAMEAASVVICHGGPSTILEAGNYGHVAIVVPRQAGFGEHVDDHQVQFCRQISERVRVVESISDLAIAVVQHPEWADGRRPLGSDSDRTARFAADLEDLCQQLVVSPRARGPLRDRLRALRTWIKTRR